MNKPTVFIHTNNQQLVGAVVGAYSMKRRSRSPEAFDVRLIRLEETPHLFKREEQEYLRKGRKAVWHNADLQSFSPLRRMVPQIMEFSQRAVVTDPDVFAMGDIYELLTMDMGNKAILCRHVSDGYKGNGNAFYASSVMLLDCAKLTHWRWDEDIDQMFSGELDYGPWIGLLTEDPETIGNLDEVWNSFDKLTPETRLLHNTERGTQPWKTGLPIDFDTNTRTPAKAAKPRSLLGRISSLLNSQTIENPAEIGEYLPHPDPKQEKFFFSLLKEALEDGAVEEDMIRDHISANNVRPDAFDILRHLGYSGRRSACPSGSAFDVFSVAERPLNELAG